MELEHCAVSGIGMNDEFAVRKPPRQVVRVLCWNHPIIVAVDHEHRLLGHRKVRRFFVAPSVEGDHSSDLDDNLALGTSTFDVSQCLVG